MRTQQECARLQSREAAPEKGPTGRKPSRGWGFLGDPDALGRSLQWFGYRMVFCPFHRGQGFLFFLSPASSDLHLYSRVKGCFPSPAATFFFFFRGEAFSQGLVSFPQQQLLTSPRPAPPGFFLSAPGGPQKHV